jgi:hypothetical protein
MANFGADFEANFAGATGAVESHGGQKLHKVKKAASFVSGWQKMIGSPKY